MLIPIITYVLFTAGMIYLLFRRDNRLRKLNSSQEDYYELKNKNRGLLDFQQHGSIGEGCVMLLLSPITFILCCVANLQYFLANLKYYLRGGAGKRLEYVKEYVRSAMDQKKNYITELKESGYLDEFPEESEERENLWKLHGLLQDWDLREVIRNNSYQEFSKEYLGIPTPFKFWAGAVVSCLGLIFWPITAAVGFAFTILFMGVILALFIFK